MQPWRVRPTYIRRFMQRGGVGVLSSLQVYINRRAPVDACAGCGASCALGGRPRERDSADGVQCCLAALREQHLTVTLIYFYDMNPASLARAVAS